MDWRVHTFESASGLFTTGLPRGIIDTFTGGSVVAVGVPSGLEPAGVRIWQLEEVQ